jgi:hypothetical protein
MRVISLDPGGTTGYAIYNWEYWTEEFYTSYGQLDGENHHHDLRTLLQDQLRDLPANQLIVICESFDHRNNDFSKLISVEYIGVVKEWCQAQTYSKLVMQGSSIKPRKSRTTGRITGWATDEKLIKLGLLIEPKTTWRHANDGWRHLAYYVCNGKHKSKSMLALQEHFFKLLKPS